MNDGGIYIYKFLKTKVISISIYLYHATAIKKLRRLPTDNPATSVMPIKPPAASLSSAGTR
jgi:hypothetical protein